MVWIAVATIVAYSITGDAMHDMMLRGKWGISILASQFSELTHMRRFEQIFAAGLPDSAIIAPDKRQGNFV
jgi:Na+-driven multidrug efflux pump